MSLQSRLNQYSAFLAYSSSVASARGAHKRARRLHIVINRMPIYCERERAQLLAEWEFWAAARENSLLAARESLGALCA